MWSTVQLAASIIVKQSQAAHTLALRSTYVPHPDICHQFTLSARVFALPGRGLVLFLRTEDAALTQFPNGRMWSHATFCRSAENEDGESAKGGWVGASKKHLRVHAQLQEVECRYLEARTNLLAINDCTTQGRYDGCVCTCCRLASAHRTLDIVDLSILQSTYLGAFAPVARGAHLDVSCAAAATVLRVVAPVVIGDVAFLDTLSLHR